MIEDQENIKYLIKRPKTPVVKPPMHRSVFNKSINREYKSNRSCHQTMGYAEVKPNQPSKFLRKHTRKVMRPFVGKIKNKDYSTYNTIASINIINVMNKSQINLFWIDRKYSKL